ncbi:LLM class flavin-dependent oxidoreductase [Sphingorhabdus sp.]|uniref:LLM class flavin-dependent oxidoreductase n=1 Tax=Sphingorhabdus sp. TaxID=1902408 RepID=UPI0035B055C8
MTAYSLLDLVPVVEGGTVPQALTNAADLARHAEALGFTRFWVAEHHGMKGIASAATSVVIGHIAAATKTMRIGAGGIMLPNHAPLVIAEQFGTLDALFPGRIDLGLGRAPGSDQRVAHAIRRTLDSDPNGFVRDIVELQSYFADDGRTGISATPGAGADVPLYILGSSLYGAQVAALLGLPYAFASHFAPQMLDEALHVYRNNFKPSAMLNRPYVMAAMNIIAADSDDEAEYLASSIQQSFVALRTGNPRQMQPPVEGYKASLPPHIGAMLDELLSCSAIGSVEAVKRGVAQFINRTQADEIIVACSMFDHAQRKRSLSLTAEAFATLSR